MSVPGSLFMGHPPPLLLMRKLENEDSTHLHLEEKLIQIVLDINPVPEVSYEFFLLLSWDPVWKTGTAVRGAGNPV